VLIGCALCLLAVAAPAAHAYDDALPGPSETHRVPRTMDAQALVSAACPSTRIRLTDLDLARRLDERAVLDAAVRGGERNAQLDPLDPRSYKFADDPDEAAAAFQRDYGPDAFITRSAQAVLAIASAAERGTQVPLDRINTVADAIVEAGRDALGLRSLPDFRLKSNVWYDEAGVEMSAEW